MSEWISVEERLPDEDSLVVAAEFYGHVMHPGVAVCWFLNGKFFFWDEGVDASNHDGGAVIKLDMKVTHWIPLPPPPESNE